MRHPFDGIIFPERDENPKANPSRRDVLRLAGSVGPALVVAGLAGQAAGRQATTLAIGEEGAKKPPLRRTTRAIGEEGGKVPPRRKPTRKEGEDPGTWGPPLTPEQKFLGHHQAFEGDLKRGDYEEAAKRLRELTSFARMKQYKTKVADAKKRLGEKLTEVLTQADADLKDGKLVEAVKTYRALSRIGGFPEQYKARRKQLVAAKLDGYKPALREVLAQELYDTACKADTKKRPVLLKQIAIRYKDTPTGKKVAEELKRPPKKPRAKLIPGITTKAIGEEGGNRKGKKAPPRATTMAVGEEG